MTRLTIAMLTALALTPRPSTQPHASRRAPELLATNDNRTSAGTLRDGVLTVRLEIRAGEWHPDGDAQPGIVVRAFAESGRPASVPGPLVRVPEGTEIHAFVRNALDDSAIVVHGLSSRGRSLGSDDTSTVLPGETRELRFLAGSAGTYYYWGTTGARNLIRRSGNDSQLGGAFIIDPRGATGALRDRVFVFGLWEQVFRGGFTQPNDVIRFAINGRAWPNTERLNFVAGDSVRFRLVNMSAAPHPMHLHGFYFDVGSRGDGTRDSIYQPDGSRHLVVTERVPPGRTATMSWLPVRPGYWLFHCHDNAHVLRNAPFDGSRLPAEQTVHTHNHTVDMMGGLVMALEVMPRTSGVVLAGEPATRRRLRLVAQIDGTGAGTDSEPAYGYRLQGETRSMPNAIPDGRLLLPGPTLLLKRGEPVGITVVNELAEPTAVHWHGIELDSYYDGVADFSGHPGHVASAIAPRDSFEARFTPPRSGTFMYHPHADELRQQQAGLTGALLVVDDPAAFDSTHDKVLLISVPRRRADGGRVLLNGSLTPTAIEMRVGERYRLRILDIHTFRPSMIARLMRDSVSSTWRPLAKDGMELPPDQSAIRPAVQQMGNGETYDFEFVPGVPGELRFIVTSGVGDILVEMPIHVR
jgi:FtsP/CotA-like multicopper oxidase with cupredoxin domain